MHNPEYVLENVTHKLFWDFEIQTDHQISARRSNLEIFKKKTPPQKNPNRTYQIVDFAVPANHWVKLKEMEKRD